MKRSIFRRGVLTAIALSALCLPVVSHAEDDATKIEKKTVRIAQLTLKGSYPEGTAPPGIFGEITPHLSDLIARLDRVAKDDKISGLIVDLQLGQIGFGHLNEIREGIARVRKADKKVIAVVRSAMMKDYQVATACDEIVMPPAGILVITGLQSEVMFFKGAFEKLGIQAEFLQVGDFKGAAEPYTRSEMSPEFRKQYETVLDDYYALSIETIAKDRKLDAEKVKQLIDEGLFVAAQAKESGLIDRVAYDDELKEQLKASFKADELVIEKDYGKKKLDTDFSGFGGFVKLMEMMSGVEPSSKSSKGTKIAVIYAVGAIMDSSGDTSSLLSSAAVTADETNKAIKQAEDDASVKAIVLRVDSPGGSALASDLIWREVVRAKKPIIASMGDTAASGGYYISMGADKILAEPGTLTGSIGVVGGKIAIEGMLNKFGVNTDIISRGKNAGTFSMTEPFTPEEKKVWQRMMQDIYEQFTTKAAEGRKMDVAKLKDLAQGKIYTGRQAAANGLVDRLGTLADAITEAKTSAGLAADAKVELLILPKPKNFFEQLLEGPSVEAELKAIAPELVAVGNTVARLRKIFSRPVAMILPFEANIK